MKMEGEIVSKESIKPSSPTPQNKKIYKLSLFDQIVPPIFAPLVLYFPPSDNGSFAITQKLKLSLSQTLSHFYPLAGRIKDRLSIDCNDEGVLFIVAKFDYRLSDFLENPNPIVCRDHIPSQLSWDEPGPGSHVAMVQVNHFACGGVAIGSLFLHKVVDGATIGTFMKAWGTTTRDAGDQTLFFSDYSAHSFFPQNESMQRESHLFSAMRQYFKMGKTVMRRYVFDSSAISTLRAKILNSPDHEGTKRAPTRVETVSAYLWKCFMAASQSTDQSTSVVTHAVNMRRKAETPFPDESFGNYGWLVPASTTNNDENGDMNHLFSKVRKAISKVDVDFVKRMEGDAGFSGYTKNLEDTWSEFPEEADYLAITSWCNFGLYSVDFGWGRAVWMSKCDGGSDVELPFINVLWLMDTRDGDGIEAWLTLDEQIFSNFSQIKELHHLALVDPSPLQIIEDSEPFKKPSF